jgi:dolichol-phosphate mannosyltransferase
VICVVVPTYNEAANLPPMLDGLLALPPDYEFLIVDDGSPDGTAELALEIGRVHGRVHVLHRTGPRGYGAASREGLLWALDRGYRIAASIDGDLTHDPAAMPDLVQAIGAGADVAIGSRLVPGGGVERGFPMRRRLITRLGNAYARLVLGAPALDNTSGYRCYTADALRAVDLTKIESNNAFFLIELIVALSARGARITEVPITYAVRGSGASKISMSHVLDAFTRATQLGIRRRLAEKAGLGAGERPPARK